VTGGSNEEEETNMTLNECQVLLKCKLLMRLFMRTALVSVTNRTFELGTGATSSDK
jgi:hypothetical protein